MTGVAHFVHGVDGWPKHNYGGWHHPSIHTSVEMSLMDENE